MHLPLFRRVERTRPSLREDEVVARLDGIVSPGLVTRAPKRGRPHVTTLTNRYMSGDDRSEPIA